MWFLHVWICHIWIFRVWVLHMWRNGETPDLRSERRFPMWEYRDMASPSKAAHSERNTPKSTFILTVNLPYLPIIQDKENRLSHRPIRSANGTGGLDFLIAYALLIVCHSLFKVVIDDVQEWCEVAVHLVGAVYSIVDGDESDVGIGECDFGVVTDLEVVASQSRHVFDDDRCHIACVHLCDHALEIGSVE